MKYEKSLSLTAMSTKPKFRSRKLDYKRPLPLYHAQELPDLDDDAHRAVPIVATGVEKEEEEVCSLRLWGSFGW